MKADENGRVAALVYERTQPDDEGGVGNGEFREVPIQQLYRAVGYFGSPLPGVPFDKKHGVIPNHEGQAIRKDSNERVPGVYATGWIKRGPVGLIGHTKSDAMETISHLINDQGSWWTPEDPSPEAIVALLAERGVAWTDLEGGIASTSMRSRSENRTGARVSRSSIVTTWCGSRAASSRIRPGARRRRLSAWHPSGHPTFWVVCSNS